ncbi:hypothetical protein NLI96_g9897 [Meripilus lineatus]|uniref:Cytochrome P450 n=1 Tax=Meripilus lineatus TaxID=2056292 RepID=A0AAD5YET2_9APHY|nr:hypothetical protein NLI96_g9897 [Physisporinus lineatus]
MSIISLVAVTAVLSVILIAVFTRLVHKYPRRHPPGPKGLPVLGNILDIPKEDAWRTYAEWSRQFVGTSMVILNTAQTASDILEKRSLTSSERLGCSWNLLFSSYSSSRFKDLRKLFNEFFHQKVIPDYRPQMFKQTSAFLRAMLDSPSDCQEQLKYMGTSLISDVVYGLQGDEMITILDEYGKSLADAAESPVLTLLSELFPKVVSAAASLPFMREVLNWRERIHTLRSRPFLKTKTAIAQGNSPAIVAQLLGRTGDNPDMDQQENMTQDFAATVYAGNDLLAPAEESLMLMLYLRWR